MGRLPPRRIGLPVVGLWLVLSAACGAEAPEPSGEREAVTGPAPIELPIMPNWPVAAAELEWFPPDQGRCDVCHDAGMPPAWALDPTDIEQIVLERSAHGYGRGATLVITLHADGRASRDGTLVGEWLEQPVSLFGASLPVRQEGLVDAAAFAALAAHLAATGLFRFEGDAITSFATHVENASVRVSRRGLPEARLLSMGVDWDAEQHPSFAGVTAAIKELATAVNWAPVPP